jgi:hypothetical protein
MDGSTTTNHALATFLQEAALHQQEHGYHSTIDYLPGVKNTMVDDASQKWELLDAAFLAYFNCTYPQAHSWQMLPLEQKMLWKMTSYLLRQKCDRASPTN